MCLQIAAHYRAVCVCESVESFQRGEMHPAISLFGYLHVILACVDFAATWIGRYAHMKRYQHPVWGMQRALMWVK